MKVAEHRWNRLKQTWSNRVLVAVHLEKMSSQASLSMITRLVWKDWTETKLTRSFWRLPRFAEAVISGHEHIDTTFLTYSIVMQEHHFDKYTLFSYNVIKLDVWSL